MTALTGVISFPTPIFQNAPIEPQFFQPRQFIISGVTLGTTTIVTTAINHNYVIGQLVRLLIPFNFGCFQLNSLTGYVVSLPSANQVELSINSSTNVSAFISATNNIASPQIIAVGDVNNGTVNSNAQNQATFVPGSFENISPL